MTIKKNELIYTINILRALEASHYDHRELTNKESYELTTMATKFFHNNRNKLTSMLIYDFSEKLIRKFLSFHKTYWSDRDIEKCVQLVMTSEMIKNK
jgi:hypothetical protein